MNIWITLEASAFRCVFLGEGGDFSGFRGGLDSPESPDNPEIPEITEITEIPDHPECAAVLAFTDLLLRCNLYLATVTFHFDHVVARQKGRGIMVGAGVLTEQEATRSIVDGNVLAA